MSYLLDTNVISELAKNEPAQSVLTWLSIHEHDDTHLSVVTIGELQQGIARLPASRRKDQLAAWLHETLMKTYSKNLLPITEFTMVRWGNLTGQAIGAGRKMPVMDGLIAATALEHNLTLVTRNTSDFVEAGIDLLNPWEPA